MGRAQGAWRGDGVPTLETKQLVQHSLADAIWCSLTHQLSRSNVYESGADCFLVMSFDKLDRTTQTIVNAKMRASAVLHEKAPKLTALEKAMWLQLKRNQHSSR